MISATFETVGALPTELVIGFSRRLKQELGKNFKTGVREGFIRRYELFFELEKEALDPISIPFVTELNIEGTQVSLLWEDMPLTHLEHHWVERTINRIREKIEQQYYAGKKEHHVLLYESPRIEPLSKEDPTQQMLKQGWLKQGPTKGKWFFGPEATAILRMMEEIAIQEILKPLGFHEIIVSNIVDLDKVWMRTGHISGMPMEIYYVKEPVTRDPKAWEELIDEIKISREVPHPKLDSMLKENQIMGLTYAQCPNIYWAFSKKTIAEESLPIKVYDKRQNSFRYESGGRHGIERVDEFHRIEPIYIGTAEQLDEIRKELFERYKHVFDDIMQIEWRTASVAPFYLQQAGTLGLDTTEDGIEKGTVDFEAWLPFRGSRETSEWLEFQNLSILGEQYTKAFNIKTQKSILWSGCSGIGLERWAVVFLAQKGLDPEKWPDPVKKFFQGFPEVIKFL